MSYNYFCTPFCSSSNRGGSKYFGKGKKWRGGKSYGSGKKYSKKRKASNESQGNGPQYNSVVSGGNSGKKLRSSSNSRGNFYYILMNYILSNVNRLSNNQKIIVYAGYIL